MLNNKFLNLLLKNVPQSTKEGHVNETHIPEVTKIQSFQRMVAGIFTECLKLM